MKKLLSNSCSLCFLIGIVICLSSCSGKVNYRAMNFQIQAVVQEAEVLLGQGKIEEGVKMLQMVKQVHKNDPAIIEAEKKISAEQLEALKVEPLLGINKARFRAKIEPDTQSRILWYIPDRIKDFFDIVSGEASWGPQIGGGLWATRAVQAKAFIGATGGIGYYQKTMLGARGEVSAELVVGPAGGSVITGGRAGIGGIATTVSGLVLHTPTHQLYQEYRDYWAYGGKLGVVMVGVEGEIHPLEVIDFIGGIFLWDFLNDDFATSRRLDYSEGQINMMKTLNLMLRTAGRIGRVEYCEQFPTIFSG